MLYKKFRNKEVASAARSLVGLFRCVPPLHITPHPELPQPAGRAKYPGALSSI